MSKVQLLAELRAAAQTERAAAVATRNIIATFTWSGLDEKARSEVADALDTLAAGHDARVAALNRLAADIERSSGDVF